MQDTGLARFILLRAGLSLAMKKGASIMAIGTAITAGANTTTIGTAAMTAIIATTTAAELTAVNAARYRIFLLSPANPRGERGKLLTRPGAEFDLAVRLRAGAATLGETFAFISGLYFRGKLAYAQAFAAPPNGVPGIFVITAARGLVPAETIINLEDLQQIASVPIDIRESRYRLPLERDCRTLEETAGEACDFVLLGSVATPKYLEPMIGVFGQRLLFPEEFVGRGDMSRGGLMLRCVQQGVQLTHVPLGELTRHGVRPPKLTDERSSSSR
jgi:hypothetical protein